MIYCGHSSARHSDWSNFAGLSAVFLLLTWKSCRRRQRCRQEFQTAEASLNYSPSPSPPASPAPPPPTLFSTLAKRNKNASAAPLPLPLFLFFLFHYCCRVPRGDDEKGVKGRMTEMPRGRGLNHGASAGDLGAWGGGFTLG